MHKTCGLNSSRWVELGVLAPGQSHFWFFDRPGASYGSVFQATAYPEFPDHDGEQTARAPGRVEVTELFVLRLPARSGGKPRSRVNITVTNCGDAWAAYSLWVAALPAPSMPATASGRKGR